LKQDLALIAGNKNRSPLARNGWRKLVERPFHSKRDVVVQNAGELWLSAHDEQDM
jgi:hypothetical protein